MCTVAVRWSPGRPAQILALRDELTSRDFDDPGRWWPEFPGAVGGRDRTAGGTWCATDVASGATALVLNRPEKRLGDPGAPSRGLLPLLGVARGADWPAAIRLEGMASFSLVLVTSDRLTTWLFDGERLSSAEHPEGTLLVTSGGPEDRKADRWLGRFAEAPFPEGWQELVLASEPADDPSALVVRHEEDGLVYATVFCQLMDAVPGRLRLEYSRTPWIEGSWTDTVVS
ncbi:NRDE family protein [Blastococcus sp. PRF04-17]|uniref:NRDE family protein n=1 Tax=Blastococcus sp. PRF04-17 TaxID=2933797 RepID=UPI001FF1896E|nr:NRDE family protein [Blastococcus sp. PRF04-17]UOY02152.1 NRDE family protein [Blastococcus sp. PRF04-17]